MGHINEMFDSAESLSCKTFSEGCLACLTGYTIHYCFKTQYEQVRTLDEKSILVEEKNQVFFLISRWKK